MSDPVITLTNVWKSYGSGSVLVHVLRDVHLRVKHGEYLAIMGPSGSGKSTLLQIAGCLDTPSRGSYILAGERVSDISPRRMATIRNKMIGFVFQSFNLLPRATLLQNTELPLLYGGVSRTERRHRAMEMLERVGLGSHSGLLPSQLSGGQKQRGAIARALVTKPELLLADEPTGNLDQSTGKDVMSLFDEFNRAGQTIILVTHDPNTASHTDRLIHIVDGRIDESREVQADAVN